jgi:transposase
VLTDVAVRRRALVLEAENIGLCTDNARLTAENRRLGAECRRLNQEVRRLTARVTELESTVEKLRRAAKRQAAPHSKGTHVEHPKRSGRPPGEGYGTKAYRRVPDHIDETVEVPCPAHCDCGGEVEVDGIVEQWVQDIPPVAVRTLLVRIHKGRCRRCGKAVRGRHPDQTSEAAGAAASMIGPHATALAVDLKKEMGVSERKICRLFAHFGLAITPGGVAQAIARAARAATPTYQALVLAVRRAEVVTADESGWRVHGESAWLWVFVGQAILQDGTVVRFVVYLVAKGRGFPEASAVLGAGYPGVIERDGWAPYRKFVKATHQTCTAHLLRRCVGMIEDAKGGDATVPQALKAILKDSLALRAARDAGKVANGAMATGIVDLRRRVDDLLDSEVTHAGNARLLKHLGKESEHLFTFLERPDVEATNWKGEQAIRPAVVNRKSWGGNFTWAGADTQEVLSSVLATARLQGRDPISVLVPLLTSPTPRLADLILPGVGEGEWRQVPQPAVLARPARAP